ncbi:MAG: hypothetical protein QG633_317 [Patescibacteria group bacterium]|jgi:hypothetical protein|nr:hypothetical protein [Patescibacteria group bacterium]
MRFEVPQFIDVEDKIFGPLTFKQFIYLAGGAGASVIMWTFLPKIVAILLILVVLGFAAALAFYKINNKPFVDFLESAFKYSLAGKLYIWKKEARPVEQHAAALPVDESVGVPRISDSKLRDLAWSLDVHDSIYSETEQKN